MQDTLRNSISFFSAQNCPALKGPIKSFSTNKKILMALRIFETMKEFSLNQLSLIFL